MARVSRRKVGKTWKVSASASSREASAEKVASPFTISPRSWPSSREIASNTRPVSRTSRRSATSCSSSGRSRSAPSSKNGAALPSESLKSCENSSVETMPGLVQPLLEVAARLAGRRPGTPRPARPSPPRCARGSVPPSARSSAAPRCPASAPRRSRPAGSSGAGSRACRAWIGAKRLSISISATRRAAARAELLRLHLADVHARQPHVGLLDQQRGLREGRP